MIAIFTLATFLSNNADNSDTTLPNLGDAQIVSISCRPWFRVSPMVSLTNVANVNEASLQNGIYRPKPFEAQKNIF